MFEFLSRETYAYKGVRFFQHGNPAQPNTSPTLRCDHPLPDSSLPVSSTGLPKVVSVDVVEVEGEPAPNSGVASTCSISLRWSIGAQTVDKYTYFAKGKHRDAFRVSADEDSGCEARAWGRISQRWHS